MKKFDYNIKILKEEEVKWNAERWQGLFFKGQYFFEEFKIHEFNNVYLDAIDVWNFPRNLGDTISVIKNCESDIVAQSEKVHVEQAMLFVNSGDDHTWQHWMQDALHLLCQSADFLKKNEDITLLFRDDKDHIIFCVKELCKLKNKIQFFDQSFRHKIKKLYVPARLPHSLFFKKTVPPDNIKYIRELLAPLLTETSQKNLTYLTRSGGNNSRNVLNEPEIIETLKEFSKQNNLNFINFNHADYSEIIDRFNVFYNSDIIVAPHGGASYHVYACKEKTQFIEFVDQGSLGLFAPALVDYYSKLTEPPFYGDGYNKSYTISSKRLLKMLNKEDIINATYE
tara:strand:- start:189 stop:1205 length:1017 start_codon:yes stop_codon:yes gene_type:complete